MAHARTAHDGLSEERLEEDLCWIVPHVPRRPNRPKDWTELNWTEQGYTGEESYWGPSGARLKLTSRQEIDSPAHLGKRGEERHVSSKLTVLSAQPQSALPLLSKTIRPRALFTQQRHSGQPAGLSKEACLYTAADWLNSSVSRSVARGQKGENDRHSSGLSSPRRPRRGRQRFWTRRTRNIVLTLRQYLFWQH